MIRFEKLRKEFDGLVAVKDLDLLVQEGEIYGLIGPNRFSFPLLQFH